MPPPGEQLLAGGKLVLDRPAEAVARLTISNPERRNALDHDILGALAETLPTLADGIETRCVLITGTGSVFSAGYDIAGIGEESFEADTALAWGLVNRVVPESQLEETALDLATELAGNAPLSLRGNKRVIRELLRAEGALDPDVERELIALREACFRSEDFKEGVRAFGEKRPARWQGR